MLDMVKGHLGTVASIVSHILVLSGFIAIVIGFWKSNYVLCVASAVLAFSALASAVLFGRYKTYKETEGKYVKPFGFYWVIPAAALALLFLVLSVYFYRADANEKLEAEKKLAEEKAEAEKLLVYILPIDKYTPINDGGIGAERHRFGHDHRNWMVDMDTNERYLLLPCQLYFEVMKNPKIESVCLRNVYLTVTRHERIPINIEQMSDKTFFRPTVNLFTSLSRKTKKAKCFSERIDPDPMVMVDNHPYPVSISVECWDVGLYTVTCEIEVSNKTRWETIPIDGTVKLARIQTIMEKKALPGGEKKGEELKKPKGDLP